jgi:hypothetical protein
MTCMYTHTERAQIDTMEGRSVRTCGRPLLRGPGVKGREGGGDGGDGGVCECARV